MDPAENMLPDKDTSFAFMRGAQARGHQCFHCLVPDVELHQSTVVAYARTITVSDSTPHVVFGKPERFEVAALDAVFIRKDPPFDANYIHLTQQLDLVADQTLVLNSPQGLRDANEKLYTHHFADLMPRSSVMADRDRILDTVREFGGKAVIKALDGAGGNGVLALNSDDQNARAIIELMTREGREPVVIQEFQPEVREGDKRVLVLNGELIGAILRTPRSDDLRANIHVGGSVSATEMTPREQGIIDAVGPRLRKDGLYFVGLDFIGEKLIEVNVTSPTGIQELGRLTNTKPEEDVIAWVEERVTAGA